MKKILTFLLIAIAAQTFAQNKLNAFVGVNYSYFTKGIFEQTLAEESFGLNIGANYEIPLTSKVAFRPGINFAQVGDRTDTPWEPGEFTIDNLDTKLSYINVPMDFKFWNRIYLVTGPQVSVLVSDASSVNRAELGFNLGTGFTVNKLFFEVGVYQGLTTAIDGVIDYSGDSNNINNGYAKFLVGYRIF